MGRVALPILEIVEAKWSGLSSASLPDSSAHEGADNIAAAYGAYHLFSRKDRYLLDALVAEERADVIDRGVFGD